MSFSKDIEFLVKARDAHQSIADAYNELINSKSPFKKWNPDKISWVEAQGTRGLYQRYPANGEKVQATKDYRNMLADLKEHQGKLILEGFFYWVFTDGATVGRKKKH